MTLAIDLCTIVLVVSESGKEKGKKGHMIGLTKRQSEIYDFIRQKIQGRGYGPTVREIGAKVGLAHNNGVVCHLKALQKKGLIRREPNMSRAIQLLENPTAIDPMAVPLKGRIADGSPIETIPHIDSLEFGSWTGAPDTFALQVNGDSMIEEHIADGDFVIIKQQKQVRDGQIVAVQDLENEVTLKRYFKEKARVRLEPINKNDKPIYRDNVNILGILVGVVRKCHWT